MLLWNEKFRLAVKSHMTRFNQSDCSIVTLNFIFLTPNEKMIPRGFFETWFLSGKKGRGGCQVVSVLLPLYSVNSSLNPTESYSFFFKVLFERNENR